ncbi:hypothetical protein BD410DRAFT_845350 [Rickenella mellea]|uniref:F-box domain-containing protein n=1 Tax=Rickenella mellea TaxID=50990 RepID=A0A4Y7PIQ2_9AGAM|nr:hypothetical protein BD410DRAFT_845350 [Rickenella mellea]
MSIAITDEDSSCSGHAAPILQIPCETTFEIFQNCLPADDEFPQPSVKTGPMHLSHVCGAWRKLAIGSPRLWSRVLLYTGLDDSKKSNVSINARMESHVEALKVWMGRSSPFLMSVHLRYPALLWLQREATRIDQLPPVFRVISITQKNASNLESFEIADTSIEKFGRPAGYKFPAFLKADTAETLEALAVRAAVMIGPPNATPFGRLRKLNSLKTWTSTSTNYPTHPFHPRDPAILLPLLHTFHLSHTGDSENGDSSTGGADIGPLLDCLNVPNLKRFCLWITVPSYTRYYNYTPEVPWDHVSQLITRSNCSLNELEFRTPYVDTPSILKCLHLSPDLKCVGIPRDGERILMEEANRLFPKMERLRLFKYG